ncbi:hypothetical protein B0T19DRAFT_402121 [Cercophora scortea]|uniref:Uncharacterized protein n=1 Tax=Cercophora scortea TaxID=314031 RepID=A0AAE0IEP7_9PEZI|nr:hypothetical protein B0T19DRAFT_402121 [Cercophora scortea]
MSFAALPARPFARPEGKGNVLSKHKRDQKVAEALRELNVDISPRGVQTELTDFIDQATEFAEMIYPRRPIKLKEMTLVELFNALVEARRRYNKESKRVVDSPRNHAPLARAVEKFIQVAWWWSPEDVAARLEQERKNREAIGYDSDHDEDERRADEVARRRFLASRSGHGRASASAAAAPAADDGEESGYDSNEFVGPSPSSSDDEDEEEDEKVGTEIRDLAAGVERMDIDGDGNEGSDVDMMDIC